MSGAASGLLNSLSRAESQPERNAPRAKGAPSIKIAAFQGKCSTIFEENLRRVRETIEDCGKRGVDFLCFPEGYLSNYSKELAIRLDNPALSELILLSGDYNMVVILGLSEKDSDRVYNTALALHEGRILGKYRKTMLTGSDKKIFAQDFSLPIFRAKGIPFGVIICHDTSFVEPAMTMRCKGARLLFTPHYNSINSKRMDEHRTKVRNNHVGLATLLQMVVVRSNVVGWGEEELGYGDSAIFSPLGEVVASAPLFKESVVFAEFGRSTFETEAWASRNEVPADVAQQLCAAMRVPPRATP